MTKKWAGFLIGLLAALPLAAQELVHFESLSGMQKNLRIAPASPPEPRSEMEIWLTDMIRAVHFTRPNIVYVSSRQWLKYAAQFETEEFGSKFRENAEYVKKGEEDFQEALKISGVADKALKEGKLILDIPAHYDSLTTSKPPLTAIFEPAIDHMVQGFPAPPPLNNCGEEYGCQFTIHFIPGSLEPAAIELNLATIPAPPEDSGRYRAPLPESQGAMKAEKTRP